jgi:hypothetical protein
VGCALGVAPGTECGIAIASAIIDDLRAGRIVLPAPACIERIGIAGRARARKLAADIVVDALTPEQIAAQDALLVTDQKSGVTPLAWLRNIGDSLSARNLAEARMAISRGRPGREPAPARRYGYAGAHPVGVRALQRNPRQPAHDARAAG